MLLWYGLLQRQAQIYTSNSERFHISPQQPSVYYEYFEAKWPRLEVTISKKAINCTSSCVEIKSAKTREQRLDIFQNKTLWSIKWHYAVEYFNEAFRATQLQDMRKQWLR